MIEDERGGKRLLQGQSVAQDVAELDRHEGVHPEVEQPVVVSDEALPVPMQRSHEVAPHPVGQDLVPIVRRDPAQLLHELVGLPALRGVGRSGGVALRNLPTPDRRGLDGATRGRARQNHVVGQHLRG